MMPVLGAMLFVAACGLGYEQLRYSGGRSARRHAFERVDWALDRANASEEQRSRARAIVGKALTDLEPWPAATRRLRAELEAAWRTDTPDRDALHRRVDEEIESLRALGHALMDDGLALHDVLTSEQRAALAAVRNGGRRIADGPGIVPE
jgi:Spy/CpxP family protein refolding chaperone